MKTAISPSSSPWILKNSLTGSTVSELVGRETVAAGSERHVGRRLREREPRHRDPAVDPQLRAAELGRGVDDAHERRPGPTAAGGVDAHADVRALLEGDEIVGPVAEMHGARGERATPAGERPAQRAGGDRPPAGRLTEAEGGDRVQPPVDPG